jgi:hypothetical protein
MYFSLLTTIDTLGSSPCDQPLRVHVSFSEEKSATFHQIVRTPSFTASTPS